MNRQLLLLACILVLFLPSGINADHTPQPPRQTDPGASSMNGILDYSPFRYVSHINPGGPYDDNDRIWGDVYGYEYDGVNPAFVGRSFAYVGVDLHGSGMTIFDVTDPANPSHVGTYGSARLRDVEVHDGIGYFSGDSFTDVVDLRADPINPPLLDTIAGSHEFNVDNAATGRFIYLDDFDGEVRVYDVTTPRTPGSITLKTTITTSGGHSAFARNGRAYIANLDVGELAIYDVTNIHNGSAPLLTEFATGGGGTHSSWPVGNDDYLYVTHEANGTDLRLFDMSGTRIQDDNVVEVVSSRVPNSALGAGNVGNVHNVFVVDDLLFTSWTEAGMVLFQISDPSVPVLVGTFDTEATNGAANFNGAFGVFPELGLDRVLISDRTTGLWIVDVTNVVAADPPRRADAVTIHSTWPNPFNPSTTIRFELAKEADVEASIYNPRGQRLRLLLSGRRDAGIHEVRWDGADQDGQVAPSGTYLLRLQAGDVVQTRKLSLVR